MIASECIDKTLGMLEFDLGRIREGLKEHDLDKMEIWFADFERYVRTLKQQYKECDQRVYYGEDWDQ